ncbi:MAG: A/G-specific adenine glycosylase [Thermoanaerobaculia bacterium]
MGPNQMPSALSRSLFEWFLEHQRPLPWRRSREPYGVWVSEVMLQQTGVETVVPYYERFLRRFPTVGDLAAAGIDEVLALWSGLGYYRRARQMHAAAQEIVDRGGRFPRRPEGLQELPGIGPYTAAAVASIAFGARVPAIDGNVVRVVSRLLALESDPRKRAGRERIHQVAAALLDPEEPGTSNQALMDLGAMVCRPRQPRCGECPLVAGCRAAASGEPESYPAARRRRAMVKSRRAVVIARRGECILFFRRPEDSELLAGLWELPWVDESNGPELEEQLSRRYGGSWAIGEPEGTVRHAITFRSIEVGIRHGVLKDIDDVGEGQEARWLAPSTLDRKPVSGLDRKVLSRAGVKTEKDQPPD